MNHETPTTEIFNEMLNAATKIWNTYDNQFGYVDEKLNRINSISNYEDNAMVFYRMFDYMNQFTFRSFVSQETNDYILNNQ